MRHRQVGWWERRITCKTIPCFSKVANRALKLTKVVYCIGSYCIDLTRPIGCLMFKYEQQLHKFDPCKNLRCSHIPISTIFSKILHPYCSFCIKPFLLYGGTLKIFRILLNNYCVRSLSYPILLWLMLKLIFLKL